MQEAEANIEKMEAAAGVKKEDLGDPEDWDQKIWTWTLSKC